MGTDRVCIKCGGSWAGPVAFDTLCAHDFDEAPEPRSVDYERIRLLAAPGGARACEYGYVAFGPAHDSGSVPDMEWIEVEHPTREGAIAAWKAEWRRRRDEQRDIVVVHKGPSMGPSVLQLTAAIDREMELALLGPDLAAIARTAEIERRIARGEAADIHAEWAGRKTPDVASLQVDPSVPPDAFGDDEIVAVQLFAPNAIFTEEERAKVLAAAKPHRIETGDLDSAKLDAIKEALGKLSGDWAAVCGTPRGPAKSLVPAEPWAGQNDASEAARELAEELRAAPIPVGSRVIARLFAQPRRTDEEGEEREGFISCYEKAHGTEGAYHVLFPGTPNEMARVGRRNVRLAPEER